MGTWNSRDSGDVSRGQTESQIKQWSWSWHRQPVLVEFACRERDHRNSWRHLSSNSRFILHAIHNPKCYSVTISANRANKRDSSEYSSSRRIDNGTGYIVIDDGHKWIREGPLRSRSSKWSSVIQILTDTPLVEKVTQVNWARWKSETSQRWINCSKFIK